jgi:hypothetical protein
VANQYVATGSNSENNNRCDFCHAVQAWDIVSYDHSLTGFILEGKHLQIKCGSCHRIEGQEAGSLNVKFRISKKDCQGCHDDVHQNQFSQANDKEVTNCNQCHTAANWMANKFDHDKTSRFKLEGQHKLLECSKCHKPIDISGKITVRYKPLDTSCSACHADKWTMFKG